MADVHFLDLPVYRLPEDKYYEQQKAHIDEVTGTIEATMQEMMARSQDVDFVRKQNWRDRVAESYGGMWRYNEIIGYIRLFFFMTQIRGEYYAVKAKRIVRSRRKLFEFKTWTFSAEVNIPVKASSEEIFAAVRKYVARCKKELPRRYVDDAQLETLGPHIDWQALFAEARKPPESQTSE